jgi:hypothetical protein
VFSAIEKIKNMTSFSVDLIILKKYFFFQGTSHNTPMEISPDEIEPQIKEINEIDSPIPNLFDSLIGKFEFE